MKRRSKLLFIAAVLFASICSVPQNAKTPARPKAPELKLRILPSQETYALREKVFTQTEFTNLTDKTLCFPEPAQDCQDSVVGYIITMGEFPATCQRDWFRCVRDGGGVPRDKLLSEIEHHWIKVAPNAAYTTKSAVASGHFNVAGRWQLSATYYPPEAAFGDAAEFRRYLQSAAQTVGCKVPEMEVSAAPVLINVVPPPDQK